MMSANAFAGLAGALLLVCIGAFVAQPMSMFCSGWSNQNQQSPQHSEANRALLSIDIAVAAGGNSSAEHDGVEPAAVISETSASSVPPPIVLDPPEIKIKDGVLQKRVFSSKMRLVFLVGLEGTGHHYMTAVLQKMCKTTLAPCPNVCNLARVIYPALSTPSDAHAYKDAREKLHREMKTLAGAANKLPEGETSMAIFGSCGQGTGMMSYPNFNGVDKALQYVDFRVLAEEAERAGIDLRVVYLSRSAWDILVSDTMHHNYGGTFMKEARVLLANAAVVESTFRELGPGFSTCFRYENITDPSQALRVAKFVAPTENAAQRMAEAMVALVKQPSSLPHLHRANKHGQKQQVRQTSRKTPPRPDKAQALVVERLQDKLKNIEKDQCSF